MVARLRALISATLLLLAAGGARAGMLEAATWLQTVQVPGLPSVPLSRTTPQLGASGSATATSIAVSLSYPQISIQVFVPHTQNGVLDIALTITQGGAQAITATPSMALATQGVMGTVLVMTAQHLSMGVDQSMFVAGPNSLVRIPMNVGVDGQFTDTFVVLDFTHGITVDFYGWTPRTKTITLPSSGTGSVVTAMGSFSLTQPGVGVVTLVSPTRIHIDGPLLRQDWVSVTTLTLTVPEPGTLLLLSAGVLALGLAWRRSGGVR
jgi:hypothetical protein